MDLKRQKIKLLLIMTWLWARLKWSVEFSRLAIFHILPKPEIHYVSKISIEPRTVWLFTDNRLSFINMNQKQNRLIIYKLPDMSKN